MNRQDSIKLKSGMKHILVISVLMLLAGCQRTAADSVQSVQQADVTKAESSETPTAVPDKPDPYKNVTASLESEKSTSENVVKCKASDTRFEDGPLPVQTCDCGGIVIPEDMECIDGMPACDHYKAKTAIPGFGCEIPDAWTRRQMEKPIEYQYICMLPWGCDLGNGKVCKYSQTLKDGTCVSEPPEDKDSTECFEGNCPCGNGFCAISDLCIDGKCHCGETKEERECSDPEETDCDESESGCCHIFNTTGIVSQKHGAFMCTSYSDGGNEGTSEYYYHLCDNPKGCYVGNVHFERGARDFSGSDDPYRASTLDNLGDYLIRTQQYGCPYHVDGDADTTEETMCPFGDCVIPKRDGHCGVESMDSSAFHEIHIGHNSNYLHKVYNADLCPGGTRYCHGKANAPQKMPENGDGYTCERLSEDLKAWVCDDPDGCACGNEICLPSMVCADGHSISWPEYVEKAGEKYKPDDNYPLKDYQGRLFYDHHFYTTDQNKLDNCGRSSAEDFEQHWDESIDFEVIKKYNGQEITIDRCLTRRICDSWPVPRKDRHQYVCDHGLFAIKGADGKYRFADRPLGLRCNDPKGCVCQGGSGAVYGTICNYASGPFRGKEDSVTRRKQKIGTDVESLYKFWHKYQMDSI